MRPPRSAPGIELPGNQNESSRRWDPFTNCEQVRRCTRFVPESRAPALPLQKKLLQMRRADARTRTGDPFITKERRVGDARPRKGTRGHVLAGNQAVSRPLEWTRVPARAQADAPVLYPRCLVRQRAVAPDRSCSSNPGASDSSSKAPETALFVGKQQSRAALLLVVQSRSTDKSQAAPAIASLR